MAIYKEEKLNLAAIKDTKGYDTILNKLQEIQNNAFRELIKADPGNVAKISALQAEYKTAETLMYKLKDV